MESYQEETWGFWLNRLDETVAEVRRVIGTAGRAGEGMEGRIFSELTGFSRKLGYAGLQGLARKRVPEEPDSGLVQESLYQLQEHQHKWTGL